MGISMKCSRLTCEQGSSLHIECLLNQDVKRLKIFEQTSCCKCWRPLCLPSSWPGPRRSDLLAQNNISLSETSKSTMVISRCGHIFHMSCAMKELRNKCPRCSEIASNLVPIHFKKKRKRSKPLHNCSKDVNS